MPFLSFRPIVPSRVNTSAFGTEFNRALNLTGSEFAKDFARSVQTWRHRPRFSVSQSNMGSANLGTSRSITVYTNDTIYAYVNNGTNNEGRGPWYTIAPRNTMRLRYAKNFRAKTHPGRIPSTTGGKFGAITYRKKVKHPGVRPRFFSRQIVVKNESAFHQFVRDALRSAIRSSGHAI